MTRTVFTDALERVLAAEVAEAQAFARVAIRVADDLRFGGQRAELARALAGSLAVELYHASAEPDVVAYVWAHHAIEMARTGGCCDTQ